MEIAVQLYLNSYKKISPELTDEELEFVKSNISILKLKKKQILIYENVIQKSIAFIYSGLIRSYFIDDNGKEINNAFFSENEFVTDYLAFIKQQRPKCTFE